MDKAKIIILDDEIMATSAIKAFLKLEGFSNVECFNDASSALEYLKTNTPDLVISDFLMPDMNGLEFLTEVKKLYPDVSKILLTGYADKENAIKAINEIGIYKYIEKPWDNDNLVLTVKNGIERSYLINKLNEKIDELKTAHEKLENYSCNLEKIVMEKTEDLLQANMKLSGIINHCADGIILINEKGLIEEVNPACENLTGLDASNLKSKNISELFYNSKTLMPIKFDINEQEFFLRDCYLKNSLSESQIPVEISFALVSEDTEIINKKFVGVIRDISLQKETDRLRDDFIATLTHDLRTPLLASIQTLKFFIDGSLGDFEEKPLLLLNTMKTSNEHLLGLVNTLLDVYKYDAGTLNLCKTGFNLSELLNQCHTELMPLAKKKDLKFEIEYDTETAPDKLIINADKIEIKRVITNLCGNAVNYTNAGGEIKIILKQTGNDVIFSVTDTGNGIPKEDIPLMFKRFSQGTSKKRSTGTGLGLYLSRQIIEAHGGKIWLESKLNKGSEFSFILTNVVVNNKERQLING